MGLMNSLDNSSFQIRRIFLKTSKGKIMQRSYFYLYPIFHISAAIFDKKNTRATWHQILSNSKSFPNHKSPITSQPNNVISKFWKTLEGIVSINIRFSLIRGTILCHMQSTVLKLSSAALDDQETERTTERLREMALVTTPPPVNEGPLFAEVDMGADSSALSVRVTVVQASTIFYDTPATLDKAERLLAEAASYGSQLVVFPEAFIGGYPRGSNFGVTIGNRTPKGKEDFRKYHAAAIDVPGPEVDRLASMALKYKVYLVMGVIERDGYTLYCTVLFFDSQGRYLGKHRKVMPTALERVIWGFGDGSTIPVYETPFGKIGAAICWENRMPLLRTAMYAKGVEIYCAPTADSRDVWQASMTHIALEGGCFVLSANQFCRRKDYPPPPEYVFLGTEEDLPPESVVCAGGSVIISPSGNVLAGPNYEGEALISADLDLGEIVRAKFDFDVVGHYSRPEVLSLVVRDHPTRPVTFTSAPEKGESMQK